MLGQRRFDTLWHEASQVFPVTRFGADATGVSASDTAVARTIAAAPAGSVIQFPAGGSFAFTSAIGVTKALTFVMDGATLTQATSNTPLFSGTASDCHWRGGTLVGPQYTVNKDSERAITVTGTSAASPATDISVVGVTIKTWGGYGVYLKWVNEFDVSANKITDVWYAGIGCTSCIGGVTSRNRIRNIVGTPNAYGIFFSRASQPSLTTDPRCAEITCAANVIRDVTAWEGLDTHAGSGITFVGNRVSNCSVGIAVVGSTDGTNTTFAPLGITVTGNSLNSNLTDGSAQYGISFNGAYTTVGSPTEYATGSITGNVVRGYGTQSNGLSGALYVNCTSGLTIAANSIIEPSPHGVYIGSDNVGYSVTGNTIIDQWSEGYSFPAAITAALDYQKGTIQGNTNGVGTKSATHLLTFGLRFGASMTNSAVVVGDNTFGVAATPYSVASTAAVATSQRVSPLAIGASGTAIKQHLAATKTWDPASVADGAMTSTTVTVTGAAIGDLVAVGFSLAVPAGMVLSGSVTASNTVTVTLFNKSGSVQDLASGTLRAAVWQY